MLFENYTRFFKPEDWSQLQEFIRRHTHPKYILADKNYFDWQFKSWGGKLDTPSVLLLEHGGKISGYLGLIPLRLNYFGREIRAGCLANLMTDFTLRNKGAGVGLIKKAEAEGGEAVYTVGYIPPLDKIYDYLGWQPETILRRFILILDKDIASELAEKPIKISLPELPQEIKGGSAFVFKELSLFDGRVNELWVRARQKYPITIIRNADYLNWRYAKNPFLHYHLLVCESNTQVESFAVLRIEESGGYRIGRIIDFIAIDQVEEFMLFNIVLFLKKQGTHLIDFFFNGNFHVTTLRRCGFIEANQEPYSSIPIRFSPIDRKMAKINFSYKFLTLDQQNQPGTNSNDWYITKGDGDQDRPNPR